ncbi:hypothetical protein [Kineosporia babensis]|uniref:Uncharacterized protein n=1 Tax=Kineosporia babensis TaxID=499548 RepID=A0A9X1SS96_9ACTN|nr:hypothetical protein [Kineosporia babensis]MCD5309370.1 hypothetical protein [Kineosporia babensis]
MPEFDLDAVVRGGERRVYRRRAVLGGTASAAGAGLLLAAFFVGTSDAEPAVRPPADLVFVQKDTAVTVYDRGEPLARVTLDAAVVDSDGAGTVDVTVDSDAPFTLSSADFVWAGSALDLTPVESGQSYSVNGFERLRLTYADVSDGELAWVLPGESRPAAVWSVGGGNDPSEVKLDRVWYLQRDDEVVRFEGTEPQLSLAATLESSPGRAQIEVTAMERSVLRAEDFVWASGSAQHAPVLDEWRDLTLLPGEAKTAGLEFESVRDGFLLWAPGTEAETVGVWAGQGTQG